MQTHTEAGGAALKRLNLWKFAVVAALTVYGAAYASDHSTDHYIDVVNAYLYQGGRMIFAPVGVLQHHLGGSFFQCLVPLLIIGFYSWRRNFYGAAVFAFWLGVNFFNLSIHAGNADNGDLALAAGNDATADWNWLLAHFNALSSSATVETILRSLGFAAFAAAAIAGILWSREPVREAAPAGAEDGAGKLARWRQAVKIPEGFTLNANAVIMLVCVVGGGVALWQHGPEWLEAIVDLGRPKPAWPSDYAQAVAQAKTEQKPMVLSFTGSDWCPACQELDKYVLNTGVFRDYVAKNLVFIEVDMPQHKSQPAALQQQNMQLVTKYGVHGFPTLVILNSDGKYLDQIVGYAEMGPKGYIAQIEGIARIKGK